MLKTALSFGLLFLVACSSDDVASPSGAPANSGAPSGTTSGGDVTASPSNAATPPNAPNAPASNTPPGSETPDSVTLNAPNDFFVRLGSSISFDVETNGTLAIEDLPSGVSASISGTKVSLLADAAAAQGDFVFTLRGSSGTATQTVKRSLMVADRPGARDKSYSAETMSSASLSFILDKEGQGYLSGGDGLRSVVTRVSPDGKIDKSFGKQGAAAFIPPTYNFSAAMSIAAFPNGDLLVGSIAKSTNAGAFLSSCVTRLDPKGDVVSSFGTGGSFCVSRTADVIVRSVHVLSDGKVLFTAGVDMSGLLVVRLTESGGLDTTYAKQGFRPIIRVGGASLVKSELDASGRLLIAANAGTEKTGCVYRLMDDGAFDVSFNAKGTPGVALVRAGMAPLASTTLAVHPSGTIYVGGAIDAGGTADAGLAALDQDGSPLTSFGQGGWETYGAKTKFVGHLSVVDDKVLALGLMDDDRAFVARASADGKLDESFGEGGAASLGADVVLNMSPAVTARGRIMFAVQASPIGSDLVRIWQ